MRPTLLRDNLLVYGVGGLIVPFIGIKAHRPGARRHWPRLEDLSPCRPTPCSPTLLRQLRPAFILVALLTLLTGVIYPLAVTGVAQSLFPDQANGSLIVKDGKVVGSRADRPAVQRSQVFLESSLGHRPLCLQRRPSAGSNLGPLNQACRKRRQRSRRQPQDRRSRSRPLPAVDLVTASGSGLDPHISPRPPRSGRGALPQRAIYRKARSVSSCDRHVEGRTFGLLGEPRVNVLLLNIALDELEPH